MGLNPSQLHRIEGIFIYFVFLLLLFILSEKMSVERSSHLLPPALFPLIIYYLVALGFPLLNGAYRQQKGFWQHTLYVLLIPLILIVPLIMEDYRRRARI